MKKFFKRKTDKVSTVNNSSGMASKDLLKVLQKCLVEKSGTVTFVFEYFRLNNVHARHPKIKKREWMQIVRLPHTFFEKKSPNDVLFSLECMKNDNGAVRYILS